MSNSQFHGAWINLINTQHTSFSFKVVNYKKNWMLLSTQWI